VKGAEALPIIELEAPFSRDAVARAVSLVRTFVKDTEGACDDD